jgi:hypothetical protein
MWQRFESMGKIALDKTVLMVPFWKKSILWIKSYYQKTNLGLELGSGLVRDVICPVSQELECCQKVRGMWQVAFE